MRTNPEMTCKGSIALGTGCRRCSRCRKELARMQNEANNEDAFALDVGGIPLAGQLNVGKISIEGAQSLTEWRESGADCLEVSDEINLSAVQVTTGQLSAVSGLPVAGYKPTQPQWALDLVNENKVLEEKVLRQIDRHVRNRDSVEIDQRAVALARTAVQDAFMWLNRAVFQPQRILGDLE